MPDQQTHKGKSTIIGRLTIMALMTIAFVGLGFAFWSSKNSRSGSVAKGILNFSEKSEAQANYIRNNNSPSRHHNSTAASSQQRLEKQRADLLKIQVNEDALEWEAAMSKFMAGMTLETAATLLNEMSEDEMKNPAAQRLFDYWATGSPRMAAALAEGINDPQTRKILLNIAALRWAVSDLTGAVAWARNLPNDDVRTEIMTAVSSEAIRSDPFEALRLATELSSSPAQTNVILRAAAEWAYHSPGEVMSWADQIEDLQLRHQMIENIAVATADQNPASAAVIALEKLPAGGDQDRALVSIVQRWVQSDPVAASHWVSEFPNDTLGHDAMENLVTLWADMDLKAAGKWLLSLEPGQLRNVGIQTYSRVLSHTDGELAKHWEASLIQ